MADQKPIPVRRNMSYAPLPPGPITADAAATEAEPLFDAAPKPTITLTTTVQHRGRRITITASDMTADQFCDLLDRRGFQPPDEPREWQTLPDGTPICPRHNTPMRQREKQGDTWYSHNVGTREAPIYCRGYHGKDSPGYEK